MAVQPVIVAVIGQRQIAVGANLDMAAVTAEDVSIAAASIKKEHGLFIAFQHRFEGLVQRAAEHAGIAGLQFAAHIDHFHLRQINH